MDNIARQALALSMIDSHHDTGLSRALSAWAETQEVKHGVLIISCLRIASSCMAQMLIETPSGPGAAHDHDCEIINTYSDYFHYFTHVAQDIKEKAAKNKS